MKRNKLLKRSARQDLYSGTPKRNKKLLKLPFLAVGCVFITSMVLATSSPEPNYSQAKIIDLPNLSAGSQQQTQQLALETQALALPNKETKKAVPEIETPEASVTIPVDDLALLEQNQIEQMLEQTQVSPPTQAQQAPATENWQEVTVKSGDNLSTIFPRVGLTASDVYKVTKADGDIKPLLNLKPGQTIRLATTKTAEDKKQLSQLQLTISQIETLSINKTENGYKAATDVREIEHQKTTATGVIESSLFGAGQTAGLSDKLIMELAYIFGWDIDFALDLRQGDSFKVVFEEQFLDGNKIADGKILAAEFSNRGKVFQAVRYTNAKGDSDYYSPNGDSMRKAFNRTPVHFSRISSKFNPNRLHPILKKKRPHRGVDYAARTGTPIMATGDGKVHFVGTKGGYGRTVILSHSGKYTTLYAHMSRYKKGIKRGQRVKQGQTIGYIGQSGAATGPHLHYEFRINGVHRNPLTVALPKAEPLLKKYRSDFKLKTQPLLAQLDSLSNTAVAYSDH
jgi:murein DD-endopeptidase MepM/ murein hydrolase activator NlpD